MAFSLTLPSGQTFHFFPASGSGLRIAKLSLHFHLFSASQAASEAMDLWSFLFSKLFWKCIGNISFPIHIWVFKKCVSISCVSNYGRALASCFVIKIKAD